MIRTVTYDDSKFKIVPREATEKMILAVPSAKILHQTHDLIASEYKAMIAAAPEVEPIEMPEDLQRDWKGIDGAIAYHLIDRHADNWGDVGQMMDAWLKANQSAPEYQEPTKDE